MKLISSAKFLIYAAASIGACPRSNTPPRAMTAHAIRAILLAMATEATRAGFLASRATKRGSTVPGFSLAYRISAVAPTTRSYRRYLSPILVMRPNRSLPPLELCRGVSPSRAAN